MKNFNDTEAVMLENITPNFVEKILSCWFILINYSFTGRTKRSTESATARRRDGDVHS